MFLLRHRGKSCVAHKVPMPYISGDEASPFMCYRSKLVSALRRRCLLIMDLDDVAIAQMQ